MKKSENEKMMLGKYNELKEKNENLEILYSQLIINENKIRSEQENLNDVLADINIKISVYTNKIDSILKDDSENNNLSNEYLNKKCLDKFNLFFVDRNQNNDNSINSFQIEYANTFFKRSIEKETMTFLDLKNEIKFQIGRSENEFFFCDNNKSIFLDDFYVKDVLFPFGKIVLKNSLPIIKIIENNSYNDIFIDIDEKENGKMILEEHTNIQTTMKNDPFQWIKRIIYGSIYSILFLIFLIFWISAVKENRDIRNYFLFNYTFQHKKMLNIQYSKGYILDDIKRFYADLFQYPPQNSTLNYFDKKLNRKKYLFIFYKIDLLNFI